MKRIILYSLLIASFAVINISCSVYETFVNLSRLKFKLGEVNSFQLNGVDISSKRNIEDFSPSEILRISTAVAQGTLPVSFILNVLARNPNDGTGGFPRTNATLNNFPWRLFIDNNETISGGLGSPVTVPGTGEDTVIPFQITLDLVNFFGNSSYKSLINLALNIGGYGSSPTQLALYAQPTVATSLGNITYPEEVKIVSYEYSGGK